MKIGFKRVHPDAKLPSYAHDRDAGMDVYAVEDVVLQPCTATLVSTGLVADIPAGYEIQVRPRSGLALKNNVTVWNSPGTIDENYRGTIGVIMMYVPQMSDVGLSIRTDNQTNDGEVFAPTYKIEKGDRIAQFVVAPVTRCEPIEVSEVSDSERGKGGFGSTGV